MEAIFCSVFADEDASAVPIISHSASSEGNVQLGGSSSKKSDLDINIQITFEEALSAIDQLNLESLKGMEFAKCLAILATNLREETWNNPSIVSRTTSIFNKMLALKCSSHDKLTDYLLQHREVCVTLNNHIRKTLVRDVWTNRALTCAVYYWYCNCLKYPLVSDYLDILIPPALLFVDSYMDHFKLKGVQCLYHIMTECGRAELRWHGRAQVIYDALQKLTYSREASVLMNLHPALIKIFGVLEMEKVKAYPKS